MSSHQVCFLTLFWTSLGLISCVYSTTFLPGFQTVDFSRQLKTASSLVWFLSIREKDKALFFLSPAYVPSKITTQNTSVLGMPEVESEPSALNFLPALRFGLAISVPTSCVFPLPRKQCYRCF